MLVVSPGITKLARTMATGFMRRLTDISRTTFHDDPDQTLICVNVTFLCDVVS